MNERIKQFALQAGGEFYEGFAGSPNAVRFMETDLEKFAEAIVRECIDAISLSSVCFTADQVYIQKLAINGVKKHFGVEE